MSDTELCADCCEILCLCCNWVDCCQILCCKSSSTSRVDMGSPVAKLVQDYIKNIPIVIFSKSHCPHSKAAKEVFDKLNQQYCTVELDQRDDGSEMQAVLAQITGARTVPRVFVKGQCIGGGTDCKQLYESGQLAVMLAS